jgi:hypothetical protein
MKSIIILFITTGLMIALTSCAQKSGNKPMQTALKKEDLSK